MPLAAADLLQPTGRVASSFFPDEDAVALAARLDAYLAEAYADPRVTALESEDRDAPARQWAYYRAFEAVGDRLNLEAATVSLDDQGARTRLSDQIKYWERQRDAALASFLSLAPELVISTSPARQGSTSVPISFRP